jgi:hypothetical protein
MCDLIFNRSMQHILNNLASKRLPIRKLKLNHYGRNYVESYEREQIADAFIETPAVPVAKKGKSKV